jgi:hypothetical protein
MAHAQSFSLVDGLDQVNFSMWLGPSLSMANGPVKPAERNIQIPNALETNSQNAVALKMTT